MESGSPNLNVHGGTIDSHLVAAVQFSPVTRAIALRLFYSHTAICCVHDPLRSRQIEVQTETLCNWPGVAPLNVDLDPWNFPFFFFCQSPRSRLCQQRRRFDCECHQPGVCVRVFVLFCFLTPLPHPIIQPRMGMRSAAPLSCSQM